jgi:hypothetical protein
MKVMFEEEILTIKKEDFRELPAKPPKKAKARWVKAYKASR